MRRHLLFGVQGPNKGAAGPARSPIQPSSTVPWGATRGLQETANPAFLGGFLYSGLLRVTLYCVPGGVRVVPAGGHKLLASPARVAAGSCKLVGGDGPVAQQVGVRAARRGDLPALATPQPQERRPDQRPSARPRSPLAPRATRPGRGGWTRSGRPRTPSAAGAFRRGRFALSDDGSPGGER